MPGAEPKTVLQAVAGLTIAVAAAAGLFYLASNRSK